MDELPFYGEVEAESVLFLTKRRALRIPTPPTMVNDRNYVASLSQLGRFLADEAGGARRDDPAGDRRRSSCSSTAAVCSACAPATAAAGANGEELGELRARLGHHRARDDPRRGDAGPSDRRGARPLRAARRQPAGVGARRQGGLEGREAARPRRSTRWAGRCAPGRKYREFGGSFVYPMGDDMVTIGMVVGLDYTRRGAVGARPAAGAEDASADAADPRRRRAGAVGREDDSRGRLRRAAEALPRAGAAAARRRRRARQRAGAEGHPLRDRVGPARGRGGVADARARRVAARLRSRRTTSRCASRSSGATCTRCGTCARRSGAASTSAARSRAR